jgi:hypothetical protein
MHEEIGFNSLELGSTTLNWVGEPCTGLGHAEVGFDSLEMVLTCIAGVGLTALNWVWAYRAGV